jgi:hypothetical protein
VLSPRPNDLAVLRASGLGWSDLGDPSLVLSVLERRGFLALSRAEPVLAGSVEQPGLIVDPLLTGGYGSALTQLVHNNFPTYSVGVPEKELIGHIRSSRSIRRPRRWLIGTPSRILSPTRPSTA